MGSEPTPKINGETYEFTIGRRLDQIPESETLLGTLRERVGPTGTKMSYGQGVYGCCAALMDGEAVASRIILTMGCSGKEIIIVEGLGDLVVGELGPIQRAFLPRSVFQCGFRTPSITTAVKSLLNKNPSPTEEGIKNAPSGDYCHCISHYQMIEAVKSVL